MDQVSLGQTWNLFGTETTLRKSKAAASDDIQGATTGRHAPTSTGKSTPRGKGDPSMYKDLDLEDLQFGLIPATAIKFRKERNTYFGEIQPN
eukprot:1972299-Amphidinium_carterae.1